MGNCNAHNSTGYRGITYDDFTLIAILGKGGFGKVYIDFFNKIFIGLESRA